MATYSTTMRYTGLSGIDTETMVQQLMRAESLKYNKLEQQRTMLQWKQETYRGVATSLQSFQSQFLNLSNAAMNMRSPTTFKGLSFGITQNGQVSTSAKVTAGKDAKSGTYKLDIKELATNNLYDSGIKNTNAKGSAVDLDALLAEATEKGQVGFNVKLDNGTAKTITFSKDEIEQIKNAGAQASKDAKFTELLNGKLEAAFGSDPVLKADGSKDGENVVPKVTAKVDGGKITFKPNAGHSITLTNSTPRESVATGTMMSSIGDISALFDGKAKGEKVEFKIKVGGEEKTISVTVPELTADDKGSFDTAANYKKIVGAINTGLSGTGVTLSFELKEFPETDTDPARKEATFKLTANNTDKDVELIAKTDPSGDDPGDAGSGPLLKLGFASSTKLENTNILSDFGFTNNTSSKIDTTKSVNDVFGETFGENVTTTINGVEITFNGSDSVDDFMKKINASGAGVTMSFNSSTEKFELKANNSGAENKITFGDNVLSNMGFTQKTEAKDSWIVLNGQNYFRSTNVFEVEGLNLQLNEVTTENNPITIAAEKDTSATLDLIKKFVDAYNSLLTGLQDMYSTPRAKKGKYDYYQPLSDDEKNSMTEKEIEKWEKEAKTGLLYRDDTINDIMSTMRTMMYESVKLDNGKEMSLFEIGITTSSYTRDGGKLIIDEEKLAKALAERGDDISQLFTKTSSSYPLMTKSNYKSRLKDEGLANRLNDIVNNATSVTNGTITKKAGIKGGHSETLNDMYKQIKDMDDRLGDMYKSLVRKENNYYMMFSKMEAAISKNNNQMASIQSMFGM